MSERATGEAGIAKTHVRVALDEHEALGSEKAIAVEAMDEAERDRLIGVGERRSIGIYRALMKGLVGHLAVTGAIIGAKAGGAACHGSCAAATMSPSARARDCGWGEPRSPRESGPCIRKVRTRVTTRRTKLTQNRYIARASTRSTGCHFHGV